MLETETIPTNNLNEIQTSQPREEYLRRIEARRTEAARQMLRFRKVGFVRLALIAIELVLLWRWYVGMSPWWLLLPAVLFMALGSVQSRISKAREVLLGHTGVAVSATGA